MEVITTLLEERNTLETEPFTDIIESNVALNASVLKLQDENTKQKDEIYKVRLINQK